MTHEHIEELRKFIQVGITQEFAHPGDPGIIFGSLPRIGFGIHVHRPEFEAGEGAAQETYPFLYKKNRAF
jgi:hypothetical protein